MTSTCESVGVDCHVGPRAVLSQKFRSILIQPDTDGVFSAFEASGRGAVKYEIGMEVLTMMSVIMP